MKILFFQGRMVDTEIKRNLRGSKLHGATQASGFVKSTTIKHAIKFAN